jgi:3-hydroxybutyryl-CoA dehydrogenase
MVAPMAQAARIIGIVGAGTMGAGIAQLAAVSGARALLFDPDEVALQRGCGAARKHLDDAASGRLESVHGLEGLAPCDLVIEAVPEDLALKRDTFATLVGVCGPRTVLATNTSSLSVTEIAAAVPDPEWVVGMHFFNPAPVMRLVEIVAGVRSGTEALALARATAEAMGRHPIETADGPGFLVNRCNRPFSLEALRIVQEALATVEQVDRIVRMLGYRMGPFELMDLVGLDTGFAVQRSFHEQSFGEPRWRPSPLMARQVAAGRLGRKSGEGWYAYPPGPPPDPEPLQEAPPAEELVVIGGDSLLADELLAEAEGAGWEALTPAEAEGEVPFLIVDCGGEEEHEVPLQGGPQVLLCDAAPLAALDPGGTSAGFFAVAPLGRCVELTRGAGTTAVAADRAAAFFRSLGRHVEWVGDGPGLVSGRFLAQLVNEACFALGEGIGDAADIDAGMVLGLNHPHGPLEWADAVGPATVLAILEALHEEYREERYRPAPALVRAVREERFLSS